MPGDLYIQLFASLLFSLVFSFLWRQSGVIYFGLWSLAWFVESLAFLSTLIAQHSGASPWLAARSFLEFVFALSLIAAAGYGSGHAKHSWRSAIRLLIFFPVFLLILELIGWNKRDAYPALQSLFLSAIYWYSLRVLGSGRRRLFDFTLFALGALYLINAVSYFSLLATGRAAPAWMAYLNYVSAVDLALKTLLAFSAMAMWIENQNDRITQLANELDRTRRESAHEPNLDYLTGLLNQTALRRRLDAGERFRGIAVVCDLDDFKSINDRFGHMVGDEVLRNVGNLIRSSVRAEDQAYRWGGDEFTILFAERNEAVAKRRLTEISARLHGFRVRGHGTIRIELSWGVAEGLSAPLADSIERADRAMYESKQQRATIRRADPIPPLA